jgi:hypothetical protein
LLLLCIKLEEWGISTAEFYIERHGEEEYPKTPCSPQLNSFLFSKSSPATSYAFAAIRTSGTPILFPVPTNILDNRRNDYE